jgi:aquaporin Z
MVYAIGPVSGCHINPAISIAMLAAGKQRFKDTVFYVIFQCIGAIAAALVLMVIAGGMDGYTVATGGLGQNGYGVHSPAGYSLTAALVAEIVLTCLFLLVIFGSTSDRAPAGFAGIAVGLSLVLIHLVGIPITGTSVNPARSLGPALVVGGDALAQVWLFIVAPIAGALLAAVIWRSVLETPKAA